MVDSQRVDNLDSYDISLAENFANLARIRQKSLTEITDFYAGAANVETSTANLAGKARADRLRLGANAIFTDTLYIVLSDIPNNSLTSFLVKYNLFIC